MLFFEDHIELKGSFISDFRVITMSDQNQRNKKNQFYCIKYEYLFSIS